MPIIRNTYHSAETNEIVGKIPPWIIRRGNTVIFMTFATLLVISFFITYQDKVPATATMYYADNKFKVTALIPSKGFGKIEIGQKVIIKPDCYPETEFGHLTGTVCGIGTHLQGDAYPIDIDVCGTTTNYGKPIKPIAEMTASIEVIVAMHPLISKFINPLKQMTGK
ncbi:hypothetical protein [Bacteroides heparinolyticus]|uniref:hypothetical protein n=1 Tax=Prevotella heparinolytica TaxID=28113 RepID=UPI0028EBD597|nr:hypothetical protein [Bacteroides heparinolyticus]